MDTNVLLPGAASVFLGADTVLNSHQLVLFRSWYKTAKEKTPEILESMFENYDLAHNIGVTARRQPKDDCTLLGIGASTSSTVEMTKETWPTSTMHTTIAQLIVCVVDYYQLHFIENEFKYASVEEQGDFSKGDSPATISWKVIQPDCSDEKNINIQRDSNGFPHLTGESGGKIFVHLGEDNNTVGASVQCANLSAAKKELRKKLKALASTLMADHNGFDVNKFATKFETEFGVTYDADTE
eukprot:TRINITY_DN67202_c4_g3_i1.p1 TRINITY_DN67202_c4_g3~~TRINITY_DN67202_c4_g3_i1.p1  ORF type:complete len:274 (+),score=0.53 TRINITY_DN67202_c4_g3_i1:100-822(+)